MMPTFSTLPSVFGLLGDVRSQLFKGQFFVYSPIEGAFNQYVSSPSQTDPPSLHTLDSRTAQYALPVEDYAAIVRTLKPTFIHHPSPNSIFRASSRLRPHEDILF